MRIAVLELVPSLVVIDAVVVAVTDLVVIVKLPDEVPIEIVTEAGIVAAIDDDITVTVIEPLFGTALSVTVPVEVAPPMTVDGERENEVIVNGVTERVAEVEAVLNVAVIVVEALAVTTR